MYLDLCDELWEISKEALFLMFAVENSMKNKDIPRKEATQR